MKYSELIELYKTGKLSEEEKKKVEYDIERQNAISEYLFENDEMLDLEDNDILDNVEEKKQDDGEDVFLKSVRKSIRRTFINYGIITGTIVIIITCFVIFALPKIEDKFYYNPGEKVGSSKDIDNNRLSLDMEVYSEMFLPEKYRDSATVVSNGNGKYDVVINQTSSYNGKYNHVAGTINKNKMVLYDANLLELPTGNAFNPSGKIVNDFYEGIGAAGRKKEAFAELKKLNKEEMYNAYFTLDKVMTYQEFLNWTRKNDSLPVWCALCVTNEHSGDEAKYMTLDRTIGFRYGGCSCGRSDFDKNKYPLLTQFSLVEEIDSKSEDYYSETDVKTHILSMLKFMKDESDFVKMVEGEEDLSSDINRLSEDIKKNGIHIYGFFTVDDKEELLRLSKLDGIDYVYTTPIE